MTLHKFSIGSQEFKLNKKYTPIKKIGEGAFGIVVAATDDATGERVAIKRIKPIFRDEWEARHTLREITIMRLCEQHPNVICLRGLSLNESEDELYIIMECMFSDLHRIIKHVRPLNVGQIKVILKQILTGLEALHSIGVIHRDLKPGNLLLTKECQVRISDFGLARFYVKGRPHNNTTLSPADYTMASPADDDEEGKGGDAVTMTQYVVTRWYRCPELLLAPHLPYATAVDVWSVGCIFAEMLNGEALFPGSSNPDQVRRILRVLGTPRHHDFGFPLHPEAVRFLKGEPDFPGVSWRTACPNAPDDALDLLSGLLTLDPSHRMTVQQALSHPYLADAPPAPGGTMELSEFMAQVDRADLSLDFEKKDASLEYLRRCIIREVDMINAPSIFSTTDGGRLTSELALTSSRADVKISSSRRRSSDGSVKAAEADTPQARHSGRIGQAVQSQPHPPIRKEGSGKLAALQSIIRRGSGDQATVRGAAEEKGEERDKAASQAGDVVTGAGDADAKPARRRSSFFRQQQQHK